MLGMKEERISENRRQAIIKKLAEMGITARVGQRKPENGRYSAVIRRDGDVPLRINTNHSITNSKCKFDLRAWSHFANPFGRIHSGKCTGRLP